MEFYGKGTAQVENIPYSFKTATELFNLCMKNNITIAELVIQNELYRKTRAEFNTEALEIINVMHESIKRGVLAEGILPGVLEYYRNFCDGVTEDKLIEFILTAGAIGMLYKFRASISAAEVGCHGEIGVACSMAAGALTAVLGGTLIQIEKAAEIAMEHHLGMTRDPVGGFGTNFVY